MDLPALRRFIAVAEHGSLSEAARSLNIAQPAVTRSIKVLEASLGATLFERSTLGMALTVFGEGLLPYARTILADAQRAVDEVQAIRGNLRGQVNLGITPNYADDIVPDAVAEVTRRWPDIRISVHVDFFVALTQRLRRSELDFVFGLVPPPNLGMHEPGLLVEELVKQPVGIVARAGHPLARAGRGDVPLAELAACNWIVIAQQPAMSTFFYEKFVLAGLAPPRQVIEANSTAFIKAILPLTDALAVLPDQLVRDELATGALVRVHEGELSGRAAAGFVRVHREVVSPAVQALTDAIRRRCLADRPARRRRRKG
ncbi:MAG: LysR family transcriptional regulator [Rhodospirillaceae bacterium]|nr:LysR family transcriptional regulator [Rhodospirillaceae bacterium]